MALHCPEHTETEMKKNYLDSYNCPTCDQDWLIHPFKNYRKRLRKVNEVDLNDTA